MATTVYLAGRRVVLSDAELLGEGGEARVYRLGDEALKLFHPPLDGAGRQRLARKLEKLERFPPGLPAAVVAPAGLVTDRQGRGLGYRMPLVPGGEGFGRLASRKAREGVVSSARVTELFRELHALLQALHRQGVVAGDLNDGNLLTSPGGVRLIDADSLQLPGFPCTVGHERFLDPLLYGVDLERGGAFGEGSDWYAFAVLLFSSLLYLHPFGGTHPRLGSLLRRAEARCSALRPEVTRPRLAARPEVLPDELLQRFVEVFERDAREPFPARLLQLPWTRCACGLEHARAACPECRALGPVAARPVLAVRGRCQARTVFETSGRLLAASWRGGLRLAHEAEGVVRREDGSPVHPGPAVPGAVYALAGRATWVALPDGQVARYQDGRLEARARTEVTAGRPLLCAAGAACYRQEGSYLVEADSERRVGQVLEGQTRLFAGDRLGVGFYRVEGLTVAFLLQVGKAGLRRLPEVGWAGRLLQAEAAFDPGHALLTVVSELDGREAVQRWLYDAQGRLLGQCAGGPAGSAALLGGRVLLATDAGLQLLQVVDGALVETTAFPDSQPFVAAGDELLPNPDGSLLVVGARDVLHLTLTA